MSFQRTLTCGFAAACLCAHAPTLRAESRTVLGAGPGHGVVEALRDLPIEEFPSSNAARASQQLFAIFITGDGGWGSLDKEIAADLVAHGISVVGLDAGTYLRERRTPERVAEDVERIARYYQEKWNRPRFAIVGYSRGADLAPFIVSRMDSTLRRQLALVAMFGLATHVGFQFHLEDLVRDVHRPTDLPTEPELQKLTGVRMMCVYGTEEKSSGCRDAQSAQVQRIAHPGAHHFKGDYRGLSDLVLSALGVG